MDWQRFIFNPKEKWIDKLDRRSRSRFVDENLALEAYNYALQKLSDDNFSRLGAYQERTNPGSYLMSVFNNLLEDYSRRVFGRPRPPKWLERMGELWIRIWRMLCLERQDAVMVKESLNIELGLDQEEVGHIIRVIKSKVTDCGQRLGGVSMETVPDTAEQEIFVDSDDRHPVDEQFIRAEMTDILETLALLFNQEYWQAAGKQEIMCQYDAMQWKAQFDLQDDEWLLLRLVYQQGKKLSAAARMLDIKDHTARRILKRVEQKMLYVLKQKGL